MYDFKKIEKKWQKKWQEEKCFEVKVNSKKSKFYNLEMFPYPSGEGLHIGHTLNYTIGDIRARFKRMLGLNVLYPMGFDSFGLPAENAAIKAGTHPRKYTQNSIKNFIKQQKALGLSYDWSKLLSSCEPEYYKWNQFFFLKFLEKGLAYRKEAPVNWCPKCDTVLANEQVHNGKCWRHTNTEVETKYLEQWFIKTTEYADELLEMVNKLNWPERIKLMQKNWIGKSHGTEILFEVETPDKNFDRVIFICGKDKTPNNAWHPWFGSEVKKKGLEFVAPKLPKIHDPVLDEWLRELEKTKPDEKTILVGHSRGGVAIMRWLEKLPKNKKIGKVILLAANNPNIPEKNNNKNTHGFYELGSYNFDKIKTHCNDFVVIHSKEDPWVPFKSGEENAKGLNAKLKIYDDKLHFGKNLKEVPELLEEITSTKKFPIFTTRPDTIFGVTFMVISAQHFNLMSLVTKEQEKEVEKFLKKIKSVSERDVDLLEKEGVFTGSYAINPITKDKIPIYAGNFVLAEYGSGMVMAVPAHDQRDFEFAKKYNIEIKQVISGDDIKTKAYTGPGKLINSKEFNDLDNNKAKEEITKYLEKNKLGKKTTQYKLRDWLISRQRYWGTPIPVIYCDKCGIVPVPEKDLPVKLPDKVEFGKGNPLLTNEKFVNVKCPKCGINAKRETDTMDTFVDSSWYYMRYPDNANTKKPFDNKIQDYWLPVDTYIGGAEHACMHLLYARFWTKALRDMGFVKYDEPFTQLFNQGMLHASDGRKMSKSLGNVINPLDMIKSHGADSLRLTLMSFASPDSDTNWNEKVLQGSGKFLNKVYEIFENVKIRKSTPKIESKLNNTIKELTKDIENFKYNLGIIKLRALFDSLGEQESKDILEKSLQLLHPFCPHITEELWEKLGHKNLISLSQWPKADEKKINKKFEEQEQAIEKLINDINNISKLMAEKENKFSRIYVYVLPNEKELYNENINEIKKRTQDNLVLYAVNDKDKHDPENKSKKVKPGRPGIYFE